MFFTHHASVNISELRPVICITTRLLRIVMLLSCQQSTCTQCTFDSLLVLIFTEKKKNMSCHLRAMAITFDIIPPPPKNFFLIGSSYVLKLIQFPLFCFRISIQIKSLCENICEGSFRMTERKTFLGRDNRKFISFFTKYFLSIYKIEKRTKTVNPLCNLCINKDPQSSSKDKPFESSLKTFVE